MTLCLFFFKQKTAYEMRISDWSSDVCSSDLDNLGCNYWRTRNLLFFRHLTPQFHHVLSGLVGQQIIQKIRPCLERRPLFVGVGVAVIDRSNAFDRAGLVVQRRSEEHTSELQSLMRTSYAVFCLKKKKKTMSSTHTYITI